MAERQALSEPPPTMEAHRPMPWTQISMVMDHLGWTATVEQQDKEWGELIVGPQLLKKKHREWTDKLQAALVAPR